MDHSITLTGEQHTRLLDWYRRHPDSAVRLRCHILLLLADGHTWATIVAVLYCSSRTVARWQRRFRTEGVEAVLGQTRGPLPRFGAHWVGIVTHWVTQLTPRAFGFVRSRWCWLGPRRHWPPRRP